METSDRIASARPLDKSTEIAARGQALRARVPRDFRTLRRIATAISIVLGPLAVGVVRATVPAVNPSDGKAAIAAMMANPDMARIELAAGVVATLFLPFAIVGLTRLVMRGAPVLAMLGGGLALIVTMFEDDDSVFAAIRAGARGYLLKGAAQEETLRAIRAVASGEAIFGPAIAQRLMHYLGGPGSTGRTSPAHLFPELTDREYEILTLIAQRKSNADIATRLVLSPKTVRNHVSNILSKLQVADRTEAMHAAWTAGLGQGNEE